MTLQQNLDALKRLAQNQGTQEDYEQVVLAMWRLDKLEGFVSSVTEQGKNLMRWEYNA